MRYLRTIDVPIDALQAYPGNARIHDEQALDESAEQNGQYRSVVARDMGGDLPEVLAGNGTWAAFRRRGDTTLRVELIEAGDDEALRIVLADNGSSRRASYDDHLLLKLLDAAAAAAGDGGLAGTGWDDAAHADLMAMAGAPPTLDDLEREHGEPEDGDLWPTIKVSVPPETRDQFLQVMAHPKFEDWLDEHERFAALLGLAAQGLDAA